MPLQDSGSLLSVDPSKKSVYYDEMLYTSSGALDLDSEGTFAVVAGQGGQIKFTGAGADGSRCRVNQSITQVPVDPTKATIVELVAGVLQTTKLSSFYGLFGALPTAADPSVEPAEGIYFRRKDAVSVAHYFCVCRKGSTETAVDSGIVGDTNNHTFKILINNGVVSFYIDNALITQISTNVSTSALSAGVVGVGLEAAAKDIVIDTIHIQNSRV